MVVLATKSILDNDGWIDFVLEFQAEDRGGDYQIDGRTTIGEPIIRRIPIPVDEVPSRRRLEIIGLDFRIHLGQTL